MTFTLAMIESPHVWKRAQMDIDAVVGMDRLPEFDDRPSLPYVDAIVREVLRWRPAFPIGQRCKASVLSDILLSILKVYRTRLRKVISTRATTYLKACPTCVFSLLVALNVAPGAMVIPNVWYVRHTPARIITGPFIIPVGLCHATRHVIQMQTSSCLNDSWMRKGY